MPKLRLLVGLFSLSCAATWVAQAGTSVNISPAAASLSANQTQQFSVYFTGPVKSSYWAVNGILGGNPTVGTISTSGLFRAPATLASTNLVMVTAVVVAKGVTLSANAQVTLQASGAPSVSVSLNPQSVNLNASQSQQFSATVTGTSNTGVTWSMNPAVGTLSASGFYTAPGSITSQQTVTVTATSVANTKASASATVTLVPPVYVSINPTAANMAPAQSQQFSANVSGTSNTQVTWSVTPALGQISSAGVYTAPASVPSQQTITVTATSNANPNSKGNANVTLVVGSPVQITTNSLAGGIIQQSYSAALAGSGGAAPYTWSVTGGALPSGVLLNTTGQLSGTPTQGGAFPVTITAKDANNSAASKSFTLQVFEQAQDAFGGLMALPCPSGAQPHFYTQKIGTRWHLCTPAGYAFWMNAIYHVAADDSGADYQGVVLANLVNSKYATGFTNNSTLNWALASVRRMQAWGFNTLAEYATAWTLPVAVHSSWPTADQTIPVKLPYTALISPSYYALSNSGSYASGAVKDIMAGVKATVYTGYRSQAVDYWDPKFAQYFQSMVLNDYWAQKFINGPHNQYAVTLVVDDTDNLQGFGAGADFPTVSNGLVAPGYNQPHLGWVTLVTAPTQTSNSSFGVTYTDTTVYAKQQLSTWLSSRYGSSIANLNAAWGSKYTTFGSAGGFGTGTGLLDEDGTCPSRGGASCWIPADAFGLAGAGATLQQDLDAFLLLHAQNYFSTVKGVLAAKAPGILYGGPTVLGTWGSPPRRQILQAAAQYVDVLTVPTIPSMCSNCTDLQQRVDFFAQYGSDKPWVSWEGYWAQGDSYMSPWATGSDQFTTQAARGQAYQQRITQLLNSTDTATGTNHVVGLKWWELYDNRGENANWGLITRRDDPYDGVSATPATGADSWGYPTGCLAGFGCEQKGYGDFLDAVISGNWNALRTISTRH